MPQLASTFRCLSPRLLLSSAAHRRGPPRRRHNVPNSPPQKRRAGTLSGREKPQPPPPLPTPKSQPLWKEMEQGDGMEFNRKRAEGNDRWERRKAMELKARRVNPVSTLCYFQILGTGMDTQDTSPSILLFFDQQRFIFNAGEGFQRFCTEHKIKLSKVDHIFLTRVCSETAGGLPGLVLTLAGMGEEGMSVNIWGPSDLDLMVEAMKCFIPHKAMLHTHSFGMIENGVGCSSPDTGNGKSETPLVLIDDEIIRISAIFVRPKYPSCEHDSVASTSSSDHSSSPSAEFTTQRGDTAVIYVCELPELKGKFDPAKAAALGLKPGPKYRDLQLGNAVMSDNLNIMVYPSDVLGPSIDGPIVLLVDCPTMYHVQGLISQPSLCCYYADPTNQLQNTKTVSCIIHIGPSSVTRSCEYQRWMSRFNGAQHIMAGHEMKNIKVPILKSSTKLSSRLNYVCPQLFPSSGFWPVEYANEHSSEKYEVASFDHIKSTLAENLLKFHLRPYSHLGLDRTAVPSSLTYEEVVDELLIEIPEVKEVRRQVCQLWPNGDGKRTPDFLEDHNAISTEPSTSEHYEFADFTTEKRKLALADINPFENGSECRKRLKDDIACIPSCLEGISREEMEITLLGTGSSQPSKYRNVSAIYINLFSRGGLLLDCGEGTLGQLRRRFGAKGADDALQNLRCIWISHIHADHHAGIVRILSLRSHLLRDKPHKPLLVIGPRRFDRFFDAYSRLEDLDAQFVDCRETVQATVEAFLGEGCTNATASSQLENTLFAPGSRMESYMKKSGSSRNTSSALKSLNEVLSQAGLDVLYSVPVRHCPEAFGVVLKARDRVNGAGDPIPGWKLVYSGDTRPCPALIEASKDATVLIHEATFEDNLKDEAIARNHSTTKEAISVGTSAGAYCIILTHFSQRYPKIPAVDEEDMQRTCIAFDLMSVNLADLQVLPRVLPYLKVLFKEDASAAESDEMQEAAVY